MKNKLKLLLCGAVVAGCAWLGSSTVARGDAKDRATNSISLSNLFPLSVTNTVSYRVVDSWGMGTKFLTLSNRPYLQFPGGSFVVRVTDAEWQLLTNHYPDRIKTNTITFCGP